MALRTLSLCSGFGGLDLGAHLAAPGSKTVCYVEREAFSASLLVARMEDEALDRAPIWDDITTFDGRAWRGAVDLIVAGFPCQEVSVAGTRKAQKGDRWLWPDVARIIDEARPSLVFLENVPGILSAGMADPTTGLVQRATADVLGDLAALGFDAEWGCLGADDVGAPHRRKRWWCLAYAQDHGHERRRQARRGRDGSADECERLGNSDFARLEERRRDAQTGPLTATWPPGPSGDWSGIPEHLWPATAQPSVRGATDGCASRVDRLRALGNGVVPQVAAAALGALAARAGVELTNYQTPIEEAGDAE